MVKDIHKIDNYLIRVGIVWLFLLVGALHCTRVLLCDLKKCSNLVLSKKSKLCDLVAIYI